jgi:hypothetical protein
VSEIGGGAREGPRSELLEHPKCEDIELLRGFVKFYTSLNSSLRTFIHYRVLSRFGKSFEQIILENPSSVYQVLSGALGQHNAELFLYMFKTWLERQGCIKSIEEIGKILGRP